MPDLKLTDQIADILRRSTISDNLVVLPEQLDRETYVVVNQALKNAGGVWKKGKGHVFQHGTAFIQHALESGVSVDRVKKHQFFPTPSPLSGDLVTYGHIKPGHRVLEPSAGDGALVREMLKYDGISITAIEIRPEEFTGLNAMLPAPHQAFEGDFLEMEPNDVGGLFDTIIMNPPFTRDQDLQHILHAWTFLKPGGRIVALSSPTWTSSLNTRRAQFAQHVQKHGGDYTQLARMKFGRAEIAPMLIFLDKPELSRVEAAYARLQAI